MVTHCICLCHVMHVHINFGPEPAASKLKILFCEWQVPLQSLHYLRA